MLIHFAGSQWDMAHQIEDFRVIVEAVHKEGHSFTRDWIEPAYQIAQRSQQFDKLDWSAIFKENMEGIARADLVIFEVSAQSFAVGYMAAIALQQKKPVLILAHSEEVIYGTFLSGMDDSLITTGVYNDPKSLTKQVTDFIQQNRIDNKDLRFNFFIDRQIYNYLRWAAFKTGKTKAEILRDLVKHEIDSQDYQPFTQLDD